MASIDGGTSFVVTMTSLTILFDESTSTVSIVPLDMTLVGDHTVDLWFNLASFPTVETNRNTVAFTVVDTCPLATLTGSSQKSISMSTSASTGTSLSEVLEFPNDTLSLSLG